MGCDMTRPCPSRHLRSRSTNLSGRRASRPAPDARLLRRCRPGVRGRSRFSIPPHSTTGCASFEVLGSCPAGVGSLCFGGLRALGCLGREPRSGNVGGLVPPSTTATSTSLPAVRPALSSDAGVHVLLVSNLANHGQERGRRAPPMTSRWPGRPVTSRLRRTGARSAPPEGRPAAGRRAGHLDGWQRFASRAAPYNQPLPRKKATSAKLLIQPNRGGHVHLVEVRQGPPWGK